MSVFHNNALIGAGGGAAAADAAVATKSLRFNSADSGHLSKTFGSAGNRDTWTWSAWIKIADFSASDPYNFIFGAGASDEFYICQRSSQEIHIRQVTSGSEVISLITDQEFRDVGGWGHLVVAVDTGQATSSNRIKVYWNGSQITSFSTSTYPSQNLDTHVNNNVAHYIGKRPNGTIYLDAYLADVFFIDGSQLDPTSFGAYDDNGVWQAAAYSGTYGTNGFHLPFSDATSTTTIAEDASGNNNDFSANNISVTAGVGNDSLFDVPTNDTTNTDSGAGGEISGNYATLNPLQNALDLSNGNLSFAIGSRSDWKVAAATIHITSGKWYWEITNGTQNTAGGNIIYGLRATDASSPLETTGGTTAELGYNDGNKGYMSSALKRDGGSGTTSYGATFGTGDIIGVAFDADNGSLVFYKNGASQGTAFTGLTGSWAPAVALYTGGTQLGTDDFNINFGQRPFAYSAPSNHKCLVSTNLPTPTIADGSDYFDISLWTGTGSSRSITGLSFSPDWVWIKPRNAAYNNALFDTVRGSGKRIKSNSDVAEDTDNNTLSGFNSDGFSLGTNNGVNQSSKTYVAWCWDAGSSTVSNTDGSQTTSVRANATAGFSIVKGANMTSSQKTFGHGLSAAPEMIWGKRLGASEDWNVYHKDLTSNKMLTLNTTDAEENSNFVGTPTNSVFTYYPNADSYIFYCFAPVAGYSAFGKAVGNNSSDGPFVFTGFRPRFIIWRPTASGHSWMLIDTARDTYNIADATLRAHNSNAESHFDWGDVLSNGFKIRNTDTNPNGVDILWAAWAENPFQANGGLAR